MSPSKPTSPKRLVLLVEDTNTVAALIQVYLMGWHIEFMVALNGREALERAFERTPDLVLSDVQMPELDGFGMCAAMRSNPQLYQVPIILLTALKDEESHSRGRMVGATAFLSKPISHKDLQVQVASALNLDPMTGKPLAEPGVI